MDEKEQQSDNLLPFESAFKNAFEELEKWANGKASELYKIKEKAHYDHGLHSVFGRLNKLREECWDAVRQAEEILIS